MAASEPCRATAGQPPSGKQGIELLHGGIADFVFGDWPHLVLHPPASVRGAADDVLGQALQHRTDAPVIGFFTNATGAKHMGIDWWREWLAEMQRDLPGNASILQILVPGDRAPLQPGLPSVQSARLDVLAATLARLDVFVAADSGPMHLAAAAGAPTIGLFRHTDPVAYTPLGPHCRALPSGELQPGSVA